MERIARSQNFELIEGATDGGVRKPRPDTAGIGFDATGATRVIFKGKAYGVTDDAGTPMDAVAGVVRGC